jgi:methylmalonyl-CoA mutase C-terminal domain/subunit
MFMKRIRVLIGILGLDQHEVGAIAVAYMLRNAGIEVVYTSKFNLPATVVQTSIEENVDVIGLSCHSWEYLYYIPELIDLMKKVGLEIPIILGGSVITPEDSRNLKKWGVAAVVAAGTPQEEIVKTVKGLVCPE